MCRCEKWSNLGNILKVYLTGHVDKFNVGSKRKRGVKGKLKVLGLASGGMLVTCTEIRNIVEEWLEGETNSSVRL